MSQEQDACADAEDRAAQFQKEKEKLEEQVKVRRENKEIYNCLILKPQSIIFPVNKIKTLLLIRNTSTDLIKKCFLTFTFK